MRAELNFNGALTKENEYKGYKNVKFFKNLD